MARSASGRQLPKLEEGEPSDFGAVDHAKNPRFIPRNLPFDQSRNCVNVVHNQGFKIFLLLRHDWFHVLLRMPTWQSVPCLLFSWTTLILLFAGLYVWVDNSDPSINCGLGPEGAPIEFGPAFAFSLETCTTVGYGLPNGVNSFFENNCPSLQVVIYLQVRAGMMLDCYRPLLARCPCSGPSRRSSNRVSCRDGMAEVEKVFLRGALSGSIVY